MQTPPQGENNAAAYWTTQNGVLQLFPAKMGHTPPSTKAYYLLAESLTQACPAALNIPTPPSYPALPSM